MRWGVSGKPIPSGLPYETPIRNACFMPCFPPCLAYAIASVETIGGEVAGSWNAATVISADGGHGLFQLTSYVPPGWDNPATNARYAVIDWLVPDATRVFQELRLSGDNLVRAVAAAFNAGWGGMMSGHRLDDVDRFTTNHYAARVLANYHKLVAGQSPF